jgi:protein SCO1/2
MKFLRRAISFIVVFMLMFVLAACAEKKVAFNSVDITGATYAQDFSLPDGDGKTRTMKDFAGKVVVVFFGFTQCPDVCPTTMAEVSSVKKALEKNKAGDGDKLQAVFISIDPERDTAPVLKAYVENFDASFVGLRPASAEALADAAKAFKIYYKRTEGKTPSTYTMDHTAASYIFDKTGKVRLMVPHAKTQAEIAHDIALLL